jgi:putative transposase
VCIHPDISERTAAFQPKTSTWCSLGWKRSPGLPTSATRHALDTLGLLLIVIVTAASLSDQAGARQIFKRMRGTCKKLRKVWVDGTYRGAEWTAWVKERYKIVLESVARAEGQKGFAVLPHRWVVERTLAWLNQCRRLSKDYEELPTTSETFVYVAMTRLMLKRLAA